MCPGEMIVKYIICRLVIKKVDKLQAHPTYDMFLDAIVTTILALVS